MSPNFLEPHSVDGDSSGFELILFLALIAVIAISSFG